MEQGAPNVRVATHLLLYFLCFPRGSHTQTTSTHTGAAEAKAAGAAGAEVRGKDPPSQMGGAVAPEGWTGPPCFTSPATSPTPGPRYKHHGG